MGFLCVVYGLSFGCLWVVKAMLSTMILKISRTKSWFSGAMVCQAKTELYGFQKGYQKLD